MRTSIIGWMAASVGLLTIVAHADVPRDLLQQAISTDPKTAATAIADLRQRGPEALTALMSAHQADIQAHIAKFIPPDANWTRLCTALDGIAMQKDAYASGLYWYTDLTQAEKAAREAGDKPILSLRMLGNLNEEFSCANSRFFRTTLYCNQRISAYLRAHYILHWKSVRPVPKITIDMGDGRVIHQTITGNSIHYVLNASGEVIDALPGLFGPAAFLRALDDAATVNQQSLHAADMEMTIHMYHHRQIDTLERQWQFDLDAIKGPAPQTDSHDQSQNVTPRPAPVSAPESKAVPEGKQDDNAAEAGMGATCKMMGEMPMVHAVLPREAELAQETTDPMWEQMGALNAADCVLDDASLVLMKSKNPTMSDDQFNRMIANFQKSMATDTVHNQYLYRATIHRWLTELKKPGDVEVLNTHVYTELFLMPPDDPWVGLVRPDTYTGLPDNGLSTPTP